MVRLLPKTFRCQSNVKPDSQDITFFETWVKIELSLNTGSEQAGRQSAMDHILHSKKLSQKMQTAFKNKQSHTMPLKQTSDFNRYCHIVKAQSIDITYLSRHCGWRGLWENNYKPLSLQRRGMPRSTHSLWAFSKTNFILCFSFSHWDFLPSRTYVPGNVQS